MLLAGGTLAVMSTFASSVAGTSTTTTTVAPSIPKFEGLALATARSLARSRGGSVYVALRIPSRAPTNTVLSQSPSDTWPLGLVVSNGPPRSSFEVLPGERLAPVRPECAQTVWLSEDGNVYPLLCSGERVNVGAWLFYARNRPSMMALARSASLSRVTASLCHYKVGEPRGFNRSPETLPEQESVFMLAAAYNGWRVPRGLSCATSAASP